jgi:glycine/D-amino acid oxidase-like deaminating enzyme
VEEATYRSLSYWHASLEEALSQRPPLAGDVQCDVAIVGAGFTGLWTAYHLITQQPDLRIVVIEKEIAGFGASGRNGGWVSALYPLSDLRVARESGITAARSLRNHLNSAVEEIGNTLDREGIKADFHKGGSLTVARSKPQHQRLTAHFQTDLPWVEGLRWLEGSDLTDQIQMDKALAATYTPHCARIHPAKLARGLAAVVESKGVRIVEGTTVEEISYQRVRTSHGTVRADSVIRATEAFTTQFGTEEQRRSVVPTYSLMVATDPISDDLWQSVGLAQRETFTEACHLIVYGQRTADNRLAVGGRGAPYHFNSRITPDQDRDPRVFSMLEHLVREWFPTLKEIGFAFEWGGPLGIARDWHPHVRYDARTGLGSAGGYVGDGVTMSYLAGATLADLILHQSTERTRLPFVGHRSPSWEREPLRWLGINTGLRAITWADKEEAITGRQSLLAKAVTPLIGNL